MLVAFHKPYGVLSQFQPPDPRGGASSHATLAGFALPKGIYPIGRLDGDSEGLLLLTDEQALVNALLPPERRHPRSYWVQVEGNPTDAALARLAAGPQLGAERTRPCEAMRLMAAPPVGERSPPIRKRLTVPDAWLELTLTEGKNRQVRRMTAAVGHPTLRLVRFRIGAFELGDLPPGAWKQLGNSERAAALSGRVAPRTKPPGGC